MSEGRSVDCGLKSGDYDDSWARSEVDKEGGGVRLSIRAADATAGAGESFQELEERCKKAPRYGVNAKFLLLQAASRIAAEGGGIRFQSTHGVGAPHDAQQRAAPGSSAPVAAAQPRQRGGGGQLTWKQLPGNLLEAVPKTETPIVAFILRTKVPRAMRQGVANHLANQHLAMAAAAQHVRSAAAAHSLVASDAALRARALKAALAQELDLYKRSATKALYQSSSRTVTANPDFVVHPEPTAPQETGHMSNAQPQAKAGTMAKSQSEGNSSIASPLTEEIGQGEAGEMLDAALGDDEQNAVESDAEVVVADSEVAGNEVKPVLDSELPEGSRLAVQETATKGLVTAETGNPTEQLNEEMREGVRKCVMNETVAELPERGQGEDKRKADHDSTEGSNGAHPNHPAETTATGQDSSLTEVVQAEGREEAGNKPLDDKGRGCDNGIGEQVPQGELKASASGACVEEKTKMEIEEVTIARGEKSTSTAQRHHPRIESASGGKGPKADDFRSGEESQAYKKVKGHVAVFVRGVLDPFWSSGTISRQDYKTVAQKVVNKVMSAHAGATDASFLYREDAQIRKLVKQYLLHLQ